MTIEFIIKIINQALMTTLIASAPALIAGMVVGLAVSIFQAISQIHEMTLTFIPKIIAIFLSLIIFGPWIIKVILKFTIGILTNLSEYARV